MREMVRPTSAADINSLGSLRNAASPAAPMRDLDLLLRLSGRIVKGCRLPGSVAFRGRPVTITAAWRAEEEPAIEPPQRQLPPASRRIVSAASRPSLDVS